DACERDRSGAHGAGLERDVEIMADEPLGSDLLASGADGEDFGVSRRIVKLARAVAGTGHAVTIGRDNYGTYRHLAPLGSGARFLEREFHVADPGRGCHK